MAHNRKRRVKKTPYIQLLSISALCRSLRL
jgi:hypothetical protein